MVSKEKELELINTIREMIKNGDSEEDIISIFEGFGLDREYIKELIERAKGKKTIHDFVFENPQQNVQSQHQKNVVQNASQNVETVKIDSLEKINDQIQKLNEKMDRLNEDLEKIKEDVETTRLILEKLMKIYRSILNKILSKYS